MARGRNIAVGIDVGTHQVKVIVAEKETQKDSNFERDSLPRIIGSGISESRGIRHGFVTNLNDAAKSIKQAVAIAEKSSGISIKKAYISIGGVGLGAIISIGTVVVTKADNEITDLDVKRAIEESEKELPNAYIQNRKIIHTIPLEYRIDGKRVLGRPHGLKGVRLEARVLYITSLAHHLSDIMLACEEADIEIIDVTASPMAASLVTLSKTQKIAGCVLANIGAETTSIIVFENNTPVSMEIFQIGSNDITNDLALGLKVSIEDAELIKLGQGKYGEFSKRKIEEIVVARLSDIFDLIEDHLRKIDRSGLLPAGIILTGGGSGVPNIEELSRIALRLPAKQSRLKIEGNTKSMFRDFEWAVAYGLVILGLTNEDDDSIDMGLGRRWLHKTRQSLWAWIKQFLP
ncbi:MAG: cell division protein FtsA [Candidatus Pacebacteria bacterium]|nr:cell division protein FtsA [Candidatus Paceibacterota bacterium]MBP9818952.1 cell division protein FtsA [Candidatus Paceibacterota bacterium]